MPPPASRLTVQDGRLADGTLYYGRLGEIAYDLDEDKVQCHVCGGWYRSVTGPHLFYKHQWTADEYRDAFDLPRQAPVVSRGVSEQRSTATSQALADGRLRPPASFRESAGTGGGCRSQGAVAIACRCPAGARG